MKQRMVISLFIAFLLFYLIYSITIFNEGYTERQTSSIEQIIEKALVQCYALEGRYPDQLEHVERYGVIFDYDKYIYYYEWQGGNLMPAIIVITR